MKEIMSRSKMQATLESIHKAFYGVDLAMVAVGLGASSAYFISDDILNIELPDGSGFAFILE